MALWTKTHALSLLPAVAVMLLLTGLLRYYLGRKPLHIRIIPLQVVAVILFLLEIGKQVLSFRNGYDLYHIPLHFCSLFIFMLPLAAFYRGKGQETIRGITAALCASVAGLTLIYPDLIYSAGNVQEFFTNYFSFHTVFFHNLVILACFLMLGLNLYAPGQKGEKKTVLFFIIGYCAIAAPVAQILQTNFNNFYRCNIAPLEAIRAAVEAALGYTPAQILYVCIVVLMDIIFVQVFFLLYRLAQKLLPAKASQT
jgi:hypothetical protein